MAEESATLISRTNESWEKQWEEGDLGWHSTTVNQIIQDHTGLLKGSGKSSLSILVTMCGKTLDLLWLCEQGHEVTGVELSELAAKQFFEENNVPFSVTSIGTFTVYSATDRKIRFFVGDIFSITSEIFGVFDAIWDCNALVAVNVEDQERYVGVLSSVLGSGGKILLATWEYDQREHVRNPFSIATPTVTALFGNEFSIAVVDVLDYNGTYFTKKFNLSWAKRPIHLLTKK